MKTLLVVLFALFAPALLAQAEMDLLRSGIPIGSGSADTLSNTGASPFNLTYTIENNGSSDLMLTGMPEVVISGENNCTVSVLVVPSTPVAAAGSTTFVLQVSPIAATDFSFDVSIANNDPDENPYTFTLDGATGTPSGGSGGGGGGDEDCSTGESQGLTLVGLLGVMALVWITRRRFQPAAHTG